MQSAGGAALPAVRPGGLTALDAQRLIDIAAVRAAPAAVAALIAYSHLGSAGEGAIVLVCALLVSELVEQVDLPLHLIPGARTILSLAAPLIGVFIAWAVFIAAGDGHDLLKFAPAVFGAWLVMALGAWVTMRLAEGMRARVAVIGSPIFTRDLAAELSAAGVTGYYVVGWIGPDEVAPDAGELSRVGTLEALSVAVSEHAIDLLVCAPDHRGDEGGAGDELIARIAETCLELPVRMIGANQFYEELLGHVPLGTIDSAWFRYIVHPRFEPTPGPWTRAFDLVAGCVMALLVLPVMVAAAVAIKLHDGGPVLYRQRRLGERGERFEIVKLRTMRVDAEASGEVQLSGPGDDRVTPVGRFLRRTHLDELPQLWNVLHGEMALVGPRPERPEIVAELEGQFAHYRRRHLVKPGLTGWAQIRCGYAGSEAGTAWKLCHDLFYVKHRSLLGDTLILVQTAFEATRDAHRALRAPRERFILGEQPDA